MRPAYAILSSLVISGGMMLGVTVANADAMGTSAPLQGLWLSTDYPALTERLGDDINIDLSLQNKGLPPSRVALSTTGLPNGWTVEIDGGGNPVTATMVGPDQNRSLTMKLTPPKDAKTGTYNFEVVGKTDTQTLDLPITLVLAKAKPATVTLEPKLPALRGTPHSSFDFDVNVKNDSPANQTYNLLAQNPDGFEVTFKEQYGSQELTSIPLKPGESKDIKVSVKPPQNVAAGKYKVVVGAASPTTSAQTPLLLDITGQPTLSLTGPQDRLSGDATAGKQRTFDFTLHNDGSAPAKQVKLSASSPNGWKIQFDPKDLGELAPGQDQKVAVSMTPSDKAIAGDYVVRVNANASGASANARFRVTVLTSTMWGLAGLGVIGAAVIVLAVAVTRYGRR